jgi:hypothetical protein
MRDWDRGILDLEPRAAHRLAMPVAHGDVLVSHCPVLLAQRRLAHRRVGEEDCGHGVVAEKRSYLQSYPSRNFGKRLHCRAEMVGLMLRRQWGLAMTPIDFGILMLMACAVVAVLSYGSWRVLR